MSDFIPRGLGWQRDVPDHRDYGPLHPEVVAVMRPLRRGAARRTALPRAVDWREFCGPIVDQESLPAGAAHAVTALVQYFERRATGRLVEPSRLFLHQTSRRLGAGGAAGMSLRTTLKALARFGTPAEQYWPFEPKNFDIEPDSFAYSLARGSTSSMYLRVDDPSDASRTLESVKAFVAAGFAVAFGFTACNSLSREADVPLPSSFDAVRGGHAVAAVGYDDARRVRSAKGALLIRNSWGASWGEAGYGWLPYAFVEDGLAADFWTLASAEWMAAGEFERPRTLRESAPAAS
jgi:C1A family cysteine protease